MDKKGSNKDLGVVRPGVDACVEEHVPLNRGEHEIGVPSVKECDMGNDLEAMVEICHEQTGGTSPSTNKLKLVSDKFKCANLKKISD